MYVVFYMVVNYAGHLVFVNVMKCLSKFCRPMRTEFKTLFCGLPLQIVTMPL